MSFTLLNDARACEDLAEHDLGHGTSVIISVLFLLKHDLMCLASSKLRAIDLAQNPKGHQPCTISKSSRQDWIYTMFSNNKWLLWQAGGQEFESPWLHWVFHVSHWFPCGWVFFICLFWCIRMNYQDLYGSEYTPSCKNMGACWASPHRRATLPTV